jgi:hypothetical protein
MFIDLTLLFIIYAFSCIAVAVSLYALWTLYEIRDYYRKLYSKKPTRYTPPKVVSKTTAKKGHWD